MDSQERPDQLADLLRQRVAIGNTMSRDENRTTPNVISGVLYTDDAGSFRLETPEWWEWLKWHDTFYYSDVIGTFTARRERRRIGPDRHYWYALRQDADEQGIPGKMHRCYLGKPEELTLARLTDRARWLAEKIST